MSCPWELLPSFRHALFILGWLHVRSQSQSQSLGRLSLELGDLSIDGLSSVPKGLKHRVDRLVEEVGIASSGNMRDVARRQEAN